ncbi:MAG: fused MFS/spermidine synthase [Gemmatimonadota bacterium]|nr:MAG: fused MFS/spermidine synthase [Gemmatimonadota bacterium]
MRPLLYLVFILSGAAGLVYESIWARYLGLFVGHAAYAQILTIGIFLGGMALGAMLVGSRTERLADPLRWYALIELAVGAVGLFFHEIYGGVTGFAYDTLFPVVGNGVLLTLTKWVIAGSLILPQSILLGTTFPLMGAGVLRRYAANPGRTLAVLYFANSLGAAVGVVIAGFYLLQAVGLPGTLLVAAMLNLVAALGSGFVAQRTPLRGAVREPAPAQAMPVAVTDAAALRQQQLVLLLLGVSFGTAVASFIYEIAWLRMLALVLGSATHSFELMLSAFILGLALGSLWVRRRADRWSKPLRALGIVQWVMGFSALATLPLYGQSFAWMADLMQSFARTEGGYEGFTMARYALCLAVMLPSTFCAGITLPLITRTLLTSATGERAIGSVYGVNTLGSIVGVAVAGLVLMPLLGVRLLLVFGATLDMALGVGILWVVAGAKPRARQLAYGALAATALVTVVVAAQRGFDRRMLASGVFRNGRLDGETREVLYYRDGRTATVAAWRHTENGVTALATNGKVDGSVPGHWLVACSDSTVREPLYTDISTQTLAPLITLAHAPRARIAAVVGHGTGMSSQIMLANTELQRVTTIEIEPEMLAASRALYPTNARVFDDPRSHIVIEDARAFLSATEEKYDIILSEPSNPWVSGVASLFTGEFYRRIAQSLAEGGVFGQWIHLYELNDGLVMSVIAAVHRTFPSYEVFLTARGDMLIVAAASESLPAPDWSILEWPAIQEDFCHAVAPTAEMMEATRLTHRTVLAALLDGWQQPNSDFYPVLDLGAERARYQNQYARGVGDLATRRIDIAAAISLRRVQPIAAGAMPLTDVPRVQALVLAGALRDARAGDGVDTAVTLAGLEDARFRQLRWDAILGADDPPTDWRRWLGELLAVERDRHGGTYGYIDESLLQPALRYLDRHDAPAEARWVVDFYFGLAGWNFGVAAAAADALFQAGAQDGGWISREDLAEGGVIAKLRTGDVAGARHLYDELTSDVADRERYLRLQLLDAYLHVFSNGPAR